MHLTSKRRNNWPCHMVVSRCNAWMIHYCCKQLRNVKPLSNNAFNWKRQSTTTFNIVLAHQVNIDIDVFWKEVDSLPLGAQAHMLTLLTIIGRDLHITIMSLCCNYHVYLLQLWDLIEWNEVHFTKMEINLKILENFEDNDDDARA